MRLGDRRRPAAERTTVGYADGVLRIHAPESKNQLVGPSGSLEVTVQLPVGSHVEGKAAASELRGVGRLGDVAFDGAYRQIKIDEAAGVRLTALDGDVEVGRPGGPAETSAARGDIRIAEAVRPPRPASRPRWTSVPPPPTATSPPAAIDMFTSRPYGPDHPVRIWELRSHP